MIRRMAVILAAVVVTAGLTLPAAAAQTGQIRVSLDYGTGAEGAELALYQVAEPLEEGYRLGEAFGGGFVRQMEACSPELALWLSERATGGTVRRSDETGMVSFGELGRGLYLVVQRQAPEGWACGEPFLVPLPLDGEWDVLACPKQGRLLTSSPATGQHPAPLWGAMGLVLSGTGLYFCLEKLRRK